MGLVTSGLRFCRCSEHVYQGSEILQAVYQLKDVRVQGLESWSFCFMVFGFRASQCSSTVILRLRRNGFATSKCQRLRRYLRTAGGRKLSFAFALSLSHHIMTVLRKQ